MNDLINGLKLSDLPIATIINDIDTAYLVQDGVSKQMTALLFKEYNNASLMSGYQGVLLIADTPTEDGYYLAGETGTYTNAGSVIVDLTNGITYINVSDTQTTFSTTVVPFESIPTGDIEEGENLSVNGDKIKRELNYLERLSVLKEPVKNAINIDVVTPGFYVDGSTGDIISNATYTYTAFIKIVKNQVWKISDDGVAADTRHIALYNSLGDFISGGSTSIINSFTVPNDDDVVYMIASYFSENTKPQIELDNVTSWQQYLEVDINDKFVSTKTLNAEVLIESVSDDAVIKRSTAQTIADDSVVNIRTEFNNYIFDVNKYAPNLVHLPYNDSVHVRKQPESIDYNGTTYYVSTVGSDANDGLTEGNAKATITGAYSVSSDLDVIQLLDGAYDLTDESSGYLLLNTHSKGVLIQGNDSDNSNVVLSSDSSTYAIRFRDCGSMKFKNITINVSSSGDGKIYSEFNISYDNQIQIFENCIINASDGCDVYNHSEVGNVGTVFNLNFINCVFNLETTGRTFKTTSNSSKYVNILLSGCSFISNNNNTITNTDSSKNFYIYGCTFDIQGDFFAVIHGTDTDTPSIIYGMLDLRDNIITYGVGFSNHALLIGRGVEDAFVFNNSITMDAINSSLALGIVVKSTPDTIGDVLIYGNFVTAPRPFYIKGGKNNDIKYNSFINTVSAFEPFGFVNFLDGSTDILSTNNVVEVNSFVATNNGITVYVAGTAEESDVTIQGNTIEDNKYFIVNNYLFDSINTLSYLWADRQSFWTSDKDVDSALLQDFHLPIRLI